MLAWFAFGLGLLAVAVFGGRWFARLSPHDLARALRTFGAVFAALAGSGLIFMGQFGLLLILVAATAMAVMALRSSRQQPDPIDDGTASGPASAVTTGLLAMRLDHATGELMGEVRSGPFLGRQLQSLGLHELLQLLESARTDDPPSVALLETYLDRRQADWRARGFADGAAPAAEPDGMDEATALDILGLPREADAAAVRAAHRRLMGRLHPDHGGSDWLAARINAARDFLLGKRG